MAQYTSEKFKLAYYSDGTSPYSIELGNDNVIFTTDTEGTVTDLEVQAATQTTVAVFRGEEEITSQCYYKWSAYSGTTELEILTGSSDTLGKITTNAIKSLQYGETKYDNAKLEVAVYSENDEEKLIGSKALTVSKSKTGAPGTPAEVYQLYIMPNIVNINKIPETGQKLKFGALKVSGANQTPITINGQNYQIINKNETLINVNNVVVNSDFTGETYQLQRKIGEEWVTVDTESVGVTYNGDEGDPARDFNVTASSYMFTKNKEGQFTNSPIKLTAHAINLGDSIAYQWSKWDNGSFVDITDATNSEYNATGIGKYQCTVTLGDGTSMADEVNLGETLSGTDAIAINITNPTMTFNLKDAGASETCQVIVMRGEEPVSLTTEQFDETKLPGSWCYSIACESEAVQINSEGTITVDNTLSPANYTFTIKVYKPNTLRPVLAREFDIKVTMVSDGQNATTVLGINLSRDSDLVPANSDGIVTPEKALNGATTIVSATMFGQIQTNAVITCEVVPIKDGEKLEPLEEGIGYSWSDSVFTLKTWQNENETENIDGWDSVIATFTYTDEPAGYSEQTVKKMFVMTKAPTEPGEKGDNAIDYELKVTPEFFNNLFICDKDEIVLPIINISVIKIDGTDQDDITDDALDNDKIRYKFGDDERFTFLRDSSNLTWKYGQTSLIVQYEIVKDEIYISQEVNFLNNPNQNLLLNSYLNKTFQRDGNKQLVQLTLSEPISQGKYSISLREETTSTSTRKFTATLGGQKISLKHDDENTKLYAGSFTLNNESAVNTITIGLEDGDVKEATIKSVKLESGIGVTPWVAAAADSVAVSGEPAKDFDITASAYVFAEDSDGDISGSITFNAKPKNLTNPTYSWNGQDGEYKDDATHTLDASTFGTNSSYTVTCHCKEDDEYFGSDSITIYRVPKGDNAIIIGLTNGNMTFNEANTTATEATTVIANSGSNAASYSSLPPNPTDNSSSGWQYTISEAFGYVSIDSSNGEITVTKPREETSIPITITMYYNGEKKNEKIVYINCSFVKNGNNSTVPGPAGYSNATLTLFKRLASNAEETEKKPSGELIYDFANKNFTVNTNLNGWSLTEPATGTDPCYAIYAHASSNTGTDKISDDEWTDPIIIEGTNGTNGINTATVFLYQRANTIPNKPGTLTYIFSSGTIKETLSDWSQTIPAADGKPCYFVQAVAASSGVSDTISNWSNPVIYTKDGENGTSSTAAVEEYPIYYAGSTPPSLPTTPGNQSDPSSLNNWQKTKPTLQNTYIWRSIAVRTKIVIKDGEGKITTTYSWGAWSAPQVIEALGSNDIQTIATINNFMAVTNGGENKGIYYVDTNGKTVTKLEDFNPTTDELHINASMINTGVFKVADGDNIVFSAAAGGTEVTIGNFNVTATGENSGAIYSGKESLNDNNAGVYLGTDGIALGSKNIGTVTNPQYVTPFQVNTDGELTAIRGDIGGWEISETGLKGGQFELLSNPSTEGYVFKSTGYNNVTVSEKTENHKGKIEKTNKGVFLTNIPSHQANTYQSKQELNEATIYVYDSDASNEAGSDILLFSSSITDYVTDEEGDWFVVEDIPIDGKYLNYNIYYNIQFDITFKEPVLAFTDKGYIESQQMTNILQRLINTEKALKNGVYNITATLNIATDDEIKALFPKT